MGSSFAGTGDDAVKRITINPQDHGTSFAIAVDLPDTRHDTYLILKTMNDEVLQYIDIDPISLRPKKPLEYHNHTGMYTEHPIPNRLQFIRSHGATVMLSVQSMYDHTTVRIREKYPIGRSHPFAQKVISHSGGTVNHITYIAMDQRLTTGLYHIDVYAPNGTVIQTIPIHWNQSTKTMAVRNQTDQWSETIWQEPISRQQQDLSTALSERIVHVK